MGIVPDLPPRSAVKRLSVALVTWMLRVMPLPFLDFSDDFMIHNGRLRLFFV
ncbi:hypothetical protein D3C87_2192570 [compost metagenome]